MVCFDGKIIEHYQQCLQITVVKCNIANIISLQTTWYYRFDIKWCLPKSIKKYQHWKGEYPFHIYYP